MSYKFYQFDDFNWNGINKINYKNNSNDNPITFNNITRQNIVGDEVKSDFHLRYFECGKNGYSTLEKHEHVHVVLILRGKGKIILDNEIIDVKPLDCIVVESCVKHQFINIGDEPFGFFCTVNSKRDKFELLNRTEVDALKENLIIADTICIPDHYFD